MLDMNFWFLALEPFPVLSGSHLQVVYASPQNVAGDATWLSVTCRSIWILICFEFRRPCINLTFQICNIEAALLEAAKVCCMWLTLPVSCIQGVIGGLCQCSPKVSFSIQSFHSLHPKKTCLRGLIWSIYWQYLRD